MAHLDQAHSGQNIILGVFVLTDAPPRATMIQTYLVSEHESKSEVHFELQNWIFWVIDLFCWTNI